MGKSGDSMLMGEYKNSLDVKGRLVIPSKFREELGEKVILTRGLDGSLFIYSPLKWQELTEKFKTLSFTEKEARNFTRFMLSGANTLEIDKQGRIIIPSYLRDYANLTKEVILVGVLDRVEIWSLENWNKFMTDNFDDLSSISSDLFKTN